MTESVTLLAENLFIIRSTRTKPDGTVDVRYYETPAVWNASPLKATMFAEYENGEAHLTMFHDRDKGSGGWADGSTEVLDVVPLYGEILNSPNAVTVHINRRGEQR